jgi:4-amino-4-deoxy-L-arabinose transferase-like glycosyltransferase
MFILISGHGCKGSIFHGRGVKRSTKLKLGKMNTIIIYILAIAFVYRVALLISKRKEEITSDARDYYSLALSLMKWNYNVPGTKLDEFRTPGYPFFISLIYRLFGTDQLPVFAIQIIINLASIYLTYLIGSMMFGQLTGILAASLLCIDLDVVYHIYDILTETLFVLFLLLSIYLMLLFDRTGVLIYPILTGLILSAMTYIKPGAGLLPVVYCLFLPFYEVTFLIGFYIVPLIPWLIRNHLKYGYFRLSSIIGYNLLVFNIGPQEDDQSFNRYIQAVKWTRAGHGFEASEENTKLAFEIIIRHPGRFMINQFKGIYRLLSGLTLHLFAARFLGKAYVSEFPIMPSPSNIRIIFKTILALQLVYLLCLYLAGIAGACKAGQDGYLLVGIILYFILLPGGAGSTRYRVPVIPLIILFAINATI